MESVWDIVFGIWMHILEYGKDYVLRGFIHLWINHFYNLYNLWINVFC